jgi:lipid A 4'-phosphatase
MHFLRRYPWILACLLLAALFLLFPAIDLAVSGLFFEPNSGFYWKKAAAAVWSYEGVKVFRDVLIWTLCILIALSLILFRRGLAPLLPRACFLFLVLALGPGLVVNAVFKNQFGRARPDTVAEFGGSAPFTPPFVISQACDSNCSFVSGHASMGFYLLSFGFVDPRRRRWWLAAGLLAGGFTGLMRMVQGAHFLSDVVFAFFAVYATAVLVDALFRRMGWLPPAPPPDAAIEAPSPVPS